MTGETVTAAKDTATSVAELRLAWQALQDGQFRPTTPPRSLSSRMPLAPAPQSAGPAVDAPGSPALSGMIIPVVGALAQCGATTLSVAVATAAAPVGGARVIECASAPWSGLESAADAELGSRDGWRIGRRGQVQLVRRDQDLFGLQDLPRPPLPPGDGPPGIRVEVVDAGWDLDAVLSEPTWVTHALERAGCVVAASVASVPGLRRLERTLARLGERPVAIALLGPRQRRWPQSLVATAGPELRRAVSEGRVVTVPKVTELSLRGLGSVPLPRPVLGAGANVLDLTHTLSGSRSASP